MLHNILTCRGIKFELLLLKQRMSSLLHGKPTNPFQSFSTQQTSPNQSANKPLPINLQTSPLSNFQLMSFPPISQLTQPSIASAPSQFAAFSELTHVRCNLLYPST